LRVQPDQEESSTNTTCPYCFSAPIGLPVTITKTKKQYLIEEKQYLMSQGLLYLVKCTLLEA